MPSCPVLAIGSRLKHSAFAAMRSDQRNISAGDRSRTMGGWVANSRLGEPILLQCGGRTSTHRLANLSRGGWMAGRRIQARDPR
jgi:hypothetical protein